MLVTVEGAEYFLGCARDAAAARAQPRKYSAPSTVVDCRGRMLITVEGAEYYLGYRKESESEEREGLVAHEISANDRGALGLVDDLLAV